MSLAVPRQTFSQSNLGLFLLITYCFAVVGFFLIGSGAVWLRGWGPAGFRLFSAPAASMSPTLNPGDYVLGAMYTWQQPQPQRGDMIFFRKGGSDANIWIKRIIGLPGDRVQIIKGRLHINGVTVPREQVEDYTLDDDYGRPAKILQYEETLLERAKHLIIETKGDTGPWDNTNIYQVPEGEVFVMGDNRDTSIDSRDPASMGHVRIFDILGHPIAVVWSKDRSRIGPVPR